jgi:nitrate reductase NapAB chaperone NapD
MTISAILVACRPENLAETTSSLNALPWAQVHYTDPGGRLVVTVEANDTGQSMDRLAEIQRLPFLFLAEMTECYSEDETQ